MFQKQNDGVGEGLETLGVGAVRIREIPGWAPWTWLRAGFATRHGGVSEAYGGRDLNLGFTADDQPTAVMENRRRLLKTAGDDDWQLVVPRQVHGIGIREVGAGELADAMIGGRGQWEADGLITQEQGVLLGVGAADCVPVLVADVRRQAVGAFHAGWRGTVEGIASEGLRAMHRVFGTEPRDCVAAVGPSIGSCCYEVGEEVRDRFVRRWGAAAEQGTNAVLRAGATEEHWQLDLWEANRQDLVAAGLDPDAVTVMGECTACTREDDGRRRYFSHRAERGRTGRMLGIIGVKNE